MALNNINNNSNINTINKNQNTDGSANNIGNYFYLINQEGQKDSLELKKQNKNDYKLAEKALAKDKAKVKCEKSKLKKIQNLEKKFRQAIQKEQQSRINMEKAVELNQTCDSAESKKQLANAKIKYENSKKNLDALKSKYSLEDIQKQQKTIMKKYKKAKSNLKESEAQFKTATKQIWKNEINNFKQNAQKDWQDIKNNWPKFQQQTIKRMQQIGNGLSSMAHWTQNMITNIADSDFIYNIKNNYFQR